MNPALLAALLLLLKKDHQHTGKHSYCAYPSTKPQPWWKTLGILVLCLTVLFALCFLTGVLFYSCESALVENIKNSDFR